MKNGDNVPICPCCENYINTVDIPLSYPTPPNRTPTQSDEAFLLPADVSLYFTFIKMVIIFLLLRFLVVEFYNLSTSLNGQYCQNYLSNPKNPTDKICYSYLMSILSGFNKHTSADQYALKQIAILNLAFTFVGIVFFLVYQAFSYNLYFFLENNDVTQDDFTILVENIPSIIYDEEHR